MHWRIAWGRRRTNTETDVTHAAVSTQKADSENVKAGKHSQDSNGTIRPNSTWFHIYSSKEEAAQATDIREEAAKSLPTPLVTQLREAVAVSR